MTRPDRLALTLALLAATGLLAASAACSDDDGVSSTETARRAYLGLDDAVARSLTLGLQGFNAATSANIPAQNGTGTSTGTIVVGGQVDQGMSNNKEMRLTVTLTGYSDGPALTVDGVDIVITYATAPTMPAALDLSLRGVPTGTFTGTLIGSFQMTGGLEGEVTLNLMLSGQLEADGTGTRRKAGTTHVTGTATSGSGSFDVDLMI
ncbi:MAG: hypothetical protein IT370_01375 [Deltaproteobacteria bacterium]|nr:hypothetical protein [Deltaproteobacteria bacterium]